MIIYIQHVLKYGRIISSSSANWKQALVACYSYYYIIIIDAICSDMIHIVEYWLLSVLFTFSHICIEILPISLIQYILVLPFLYYFFFGRHMRKCLNYDYQRSAISLYGGVLHHSIRCIFGRIFSKFIHAIHINGNKIFSSLLWLIRSDRNKINSGPPACEQHNCVLRDHGYHFSVIILTTTRQLGLAFWLQKQHRSLCHTIWDNRCIYSCTRTSLIQNWIDEAWINFFFF